MIDNKVRTEKYEIVKVRTEIVFLLRYNIYNRTSNNQVLPTTTVAGGGIAAGQSSSNNSSNLLLSALAVVLLVVLISVLCFFKRRVDRVEKFKNDYLKLRRPLPDVLLENKSPTMRSKQRLANALHRISHHVYEELTDGEAMPAYENLKPATNYINLKFSDENNDPNNHKNRGNCSWYSSLNLSDVKNSSKNHKINKNRRNYPWYASLQTISSLNPTSTLKSFSSVASDWV